MDWAAVSKAPSWCAATEAATDPGPTMLSFAGPSYAVAQLQDFSAGLVQRTRPATATARRGRALGAAGAGAGGEACSVDGCRSDLRRCREYHRRHKVCEAHSKTPVVVVRGQEQRFCQQCSRFHMLPEFDEGKRSCRKRLDGHNRRRRKPQHDAMDPRSFFPYHQVNQFSVYPRTFPIADRSADVLIHPLDHQRPFSISFSETIKAHSPLDDGSSILRTNTTNGSRCIGSYRTLDPECALSLLSSSLHLSPAIIPRAAGPSQFASSFARIASASQAATSAFASHGAAAIDNVLVPDGMFEDPSQALRFSWQE